jgi:hypothetical protein
VHAGTRAERKARGESRWLAPASPAIMM